MTTTSTPEVSVDQALAEIARRAHNKRPRTKYQPAKCEAAKALHNAELAAIAQAPAPAKKAPAKKAPAKVADPLWAEATRIATEAGDPRGSTPWWASVHEILAELRGATVELAPEPELAPVELVWVRIDASEILLPADVAERITRALAVA